jgi:hypothetical protein
MTPKREANTDFHDGHAYISTSRYRKRDGDCWETLRAEINITNSYQLYLKHPEVISDLSIGCYIDFIKVVLIPDYALVTQLELPSPSGFLHFYRLTITCLPIGAKFGSPLPVINRSQFRRIKVLLVRFNQSFHGSVRRDNAQFGLVLSVDDFSFQTKFC